MQSSDRNTMITRAERPMNRPYFWAIQDVNANRTVQKNVILTIQNLQIIVMDSEISHLLAMQKH